MCLPPARLPCRERVLRWAAQCAALIAPYGAAEPAMPPGDEQYSRTRPCCSHRVRRSFLSPRLAARGFTTGYGEGEGGLTTALCASTTLFRSSQPVRRNKRSALRRRREGAGRPMCLPPARLPCRERVLRWAAQCASLIAPYGLSPRTFVILRLVHPRHHDVADRHQQKP